jgi:UDP-N-acetylmuramoylalanine--D-glutamate ligase
MSVTDLHVIVGLGATGLSCARYLQKRGIPIAVTDSRENPPQLAAFQQSNPDVPVMLRGLNEAILASAATIVLSPGVALNEPVISAQVKRGTPVIGDIELFARAVTAPVIAITGTNAKSTVTTLVGMMTKAAGYAVQVGGNLGVPALDLLGENPKTNLFVLELSSFQLETTYSLQPSVATVLNVTPDHMDRYETVAAYQQAKHRIYQNCELAVCNRDDPLTDTNAPRKLNFTLQTPGKNEFGLLVKDGETYLAFETNTLLSVRELPVAGSHYHANALAALAIGYGFGLPFEPMLNVLREFKGLPHRCQLVRERRDVRWYNDSKGTNVGATQAAIEGLGSVIRGKLVLIAGGLGKNADFNPLVPLIEKYTRHVVLIGKAAPDIAEAIGKRVPVSFAESMDDAILEADKYAQAGDSVLLSPACASYDMFKHFEHRGEVFTKIVQGL